MIITGIFLFLLGTRLGHAAPMTVVNEQICESFILPGLESPPPFAPSFIHQGSNFVFNPQAVMPPPGIIPTGIESIIVPPINEVAILNPQMKTEGIIEKVELVVPELPRIEIDRVPIELIKTNPPVQVLVEERRADIEIKNMLPNVPMLIEERIQPARRMFVSESGVQNIHVNEIPPPLQQPPLLLTEIPKSVIVNDNQRAIFVPSAPELKMFYPPSMVRAENPLFPVDCAQNIVLERVLPNIFKYGKPIEVISLPSSKRAPVVSSLIY